MNKDYIFCTKCGHKNPRSSKFCIKCGARLVSGSNPQPAAMPINRPQVTRPSPAPAKFFRKDNGWLWTIIILVVIFCGSAIYRQEQKQQRADIRSAVYDELSKSEFKVKIDQDEQEVEIVPYGDGAQYALRIIGNLAADSEAADEMDDSVKAISKKIDKKVGDGWTVGLQNPDNSKRYFWIYKDGKCKYRLQDHAVSYDDYDDYGYEDD